MIDGKNQMASSTSINSMTECSNATHDFVSSTLVGNQLMDVSAQTKKPSILNEETSEMFEKIEDEKVTKRLYMEIQLNY